MYADTHVHAFRRDWAEAIDLHIYTRNQDGTRSICRSIQVEPLDESQSYNAPLSLNRTNAQELMDSLWHCGIRPTEGEGSAGQSAAQQAHLKDLRETIDRLFGHLEKHP